MCVFVICFCRFCFFFFKQKTAYEMRISDWSSDVCSSDLDDDVAVLLLTQVHYKSGRVRDMAEVTRKAHDVGALVVWDLSHSAGAIPVDLNGANADFAIGCGYKFLNGGPGAPAYLFAAARHQAARSEEHTSELQSLMRISYAVF